MKALLDENLPHELRPLLMPIHDVFTVAFLGWDGTANGTLLSLAAANGFDVVVTTDRGYEHQHDLTRLPSAVVLLLSKSNKIDDVRQLLAPLVLALDTLVPSTLVKLSR